MDLQTIQNFCLTLPGTTEDIKWGHHVTFLVAEKMYAIFSMEQEFRLSVKTPVDLFEVLTRKEGIIPAPYLARYHWVTLTAPNALPADQLKDLIRGSYDLIFGKLSKKIQRQITENA